MTVSTNAEQKNANTISREAKHRFLMCAPDHFSVEYVINPWMEGNVHRSSIELSREQWKNLNKVLATEGTVELLQQPEGVPDLVFTANAGLVLGDRAILSHFRHPERQCEEPYNKAWFEDQGFEVIEMPRGVYFEGAGDGLFLRDGSGVMVLGYGFRSVLEAAPFVADALSIDVVPVKLVDERFYHLDTCFCPLRGGKLIWFPGAFDERSIRAIEALVPENDRYAVSEKDAAYFSCNAVDTGEAVVLNNATPELEARLQAWGFRVIRTPLDQFLLAGGAAKCLTLRLDEEPARQKSTNRTPVIVTREVEFRGHIVDDGTLGKAMDLIPAAGGSYTVLRFEPGQKKEDDSYIRLRVTAPDRDTLEQLVLQLIDLGAMLQDEEEHPAVVRVVEKDGVAPRDFYSTSIFPTDIYHEGRWIRVEKQRMDAVVVLEGHGASTRAVCRLLRDLRKGDRLIAGSDGIRIHVRREAAEEEDFKFMGSAVSSERRVESAVEHIAWELKRIRERGGRTVVVAGPVVIHTGGGPYLGRLVRDGYISALLGGNAIAVHDLESQFHGTSLGVDLRRGGPVGGGHRHHIDTINVIREYGSIPEAVEAGVVTGGLFYELVKAGVPYCLAGSIRDDGPLPDTEMDLFKAQAEYARLLEGADMVIMLSSMLHSIGTGNMTPAGVRMISVDINPAVATKLADRGSTDSTPVVTDVGLFLNLLSRKLEEMES
ncbi:MAG: TIGR00300 family protein [Candidatus Sumerlaeia bacterium]|nr:TIGR00300 family protein [Candidatus Sumerlaeia bacterium]